MDPSRTRIAAVAFALLLVVSAATSGVALSEPAEAVGTDPTSVSAPTAGEATSLSLRTDARTKLEGATLRGKPGLKEELLRALNGTVGAHVAPDRVNESVFAADREVITRTRNHAPEVAERIVEADRRLARTALADARKTHDRLATNENVSYDERRVERHLRLARNALLSDEDGADEGDQKGKKGDAEANGETGRDRALMERYNRYRRAWRHAQQALDIMDAAVDPRVDIDTRADPTHGTGYTYRLNGTVRDVRTFEIHAVNVSFADGTSKRVAVDAGSEVLATGTFNSTLTLDKRVNDITVTAADPNTQLGTVSSDEDDGGSESGNGEAGDRNGDRESNDGAPAEGRGSGDADEVTGGEDEADDGVIRTPSSSVGTDTLLLDADRLPDTYERSVTETGPLDPDSDSSRTDASEVGDEVVDGEEDFEDDRVRTYVEYRAGTDPFDPDTDDDDLTDKFELDYANLDPLDDDTDGDGTFDDADDNEPDELSNVREQRYGTNPNVADTDGDRLIDGYEVDTTRTDPTDGDSNSARTDANESDDGTVDGAEDFDGEALVTRTEQNASTDPFDPDTDTDTLTDLFEYRFATVDPLVADTDGDGVPDGQEDPDGETLVNVREQRYGTDPLDPDTDDDDLTEAYEVDATETNPLIPDSDSTATALDESDDGVLDGAEDFDSDGLSNAAEFEAGTDPFDPDTDDDGLRDGFEVRYDTLSPLANDTDGDGVPDAREDPDGELLINVDEQAAGTDPHDPDTDNDTLTDAFEVERSFTSPRSADSNSTATSANESNNGIGDAIEDLENDTLDNSREQGLGTHPLDKDTDADEVTDAYEVETIKTDPLSDDSDTPLTDRDDASNGIVDGAEDFDDDQVQSHYEEVFDTDPLDADTDDDTLTDGFEVRFSVLNPRSADSDEDSVPDGGADLDDDGLDNRAEETNGTDPTANDTDFDTLSDRAETRTHGTDPRTPDTDSDGLRDDEELSLGTSPTVVDTDRDGTPDGQETYTTGTANKSVGAEVAVTGAGSIADGVKITNATEAVPESQEIDAAVSGVVEFTAIEEFEEATITLSYDDSAINDESDVGLFR